MLLDLLTLGLTGLLSYMTKDNDFKVPIEKVSLDGDVELFTGIPYMIFPETHGGNRAMVHGDMDTLTWSYKELLLVTELDRFQWSNYESDGGNANLAQFMIFPMNPSCYSIKLLNPASFLYPNPEDPFIAPELGQGWPLQDPRMVEKLFWEHQCIRFRSTKPGFVVTKADNQYFSASDSKTIEYLDTMTDYAQMKWKPVVAPGKGRIVNMKYDEDEGEVNDSTVPLVMSKRTYINNSSLTQSHVFKATHKQVETHSFSFSSSFKVFSSVSVEAGVPLLGSATVETGFEAEFGSSTGFSTEVTREFSVEEPLEIPPKTKITAIATLSLVEGVKLPVTVTIKATLDVRRLEEVSEGSYKILSEPASGDFVKAYLMSENVDGRIISIDGNVVTMETQAEVQATYGIDSFVSVNEEPL